MQKALEPAHPQVKRSRGAAGERRGRAAAPCTPLLEPPAPREGQRRAGLPLETCRGQGFCVLEHGFLQKPSLAAAPSEPLGTDFLQGNKQPWITSESLGGVGAATLGALCLAEGALALGRVEGTIRFESTEGAGLQLDGFLSAVP